MAHACGGAFGGKSPALQQLNKRPIPQTHRVTIVRIDMHFGAEGVVYSYLDADEDGWSVAVQADVYVGVVLEAAGGGLGGVEVDVAVGADQSGFQDDGARGADKGEAEAVAVVAAGADGGRILEAEGEAIGEAEFYLAGF